MKEKMKKNWPGLLSILLLVLVNFMYFLPFVTMKFKVDGVKENINLSIFNLIKGITLNINNVAINVPKNNLIIILFLLTFLAIVINTILVITNNKILRYFNNIILSLILVTVICLPYIYNLLIKNNVIIIEYLKSLKPLKNGMYVFIPLLIGCIIFISNFKNIKSEKCNIYEITEISVLIALALVLDKVAIPIKSDGGSINLSSIPLFIICYRYGFVKGLISCSIIFGLISNIFDGYGFNTYPFDYLIAFSGYSVAGLLKLLFNKTNKIKKIYKFNLIIILTYVIASVVRLIGSSLSSIINYNLNIKQALEYNVAYIIPTAIFSAIILLAISHILLDIFNKYEIKPIKINKSNK